MLLLRTKITIKFTLNRKAVLTTASVSCEKGPKPFDEASLNCGKMPSSLTMHCYATTSSHGVMNGRWCGIYLQSRHTKNGTTTFTCQYIYNHMYIHTHACTHKRGKTMYQKFNSFKSTNQSSDLQPRTKETIGKHTDETNQLSNMAGWRVSNTRRQCRLGTVEIYQSQTWYCRENPVSKAVRRHSGNSNLRWHSGNLNLRRHSAAAAPARRRRRR